MLSHVSSIHTEIPTADVNTILELARHTQRQAFYESNPSWWFCPAFIPDDGIKRGVDHGLVVDPGEVAIDQLKLKDPEHDWPDGLDLDVGKVLADASMATRTEGHIGELLAVGLALIKESGRRRKKKNKKNFKNMFCFVKTLSIYWS